MPQTYLYRARDIHGRLFRGRIEAETSLAAAATLRSRHYFVTEMRPAPDTSRELAMRIPWVGKVGVREMAVFCRQFATMIEAGVPILGVLEILVRQTDNVALRKALIAVIADLRGGRTLAQALEAQPCVFPPLLVSMVKAGEVGGVLDTALTRMAEHFEREHDLLEKVKSAMTYPLILLVVGFLAVGFLVTFVLPSFIDILANVGVPLPLPTRVLMAMSGYSHQYWYLVLAVTIGGFLALGQALRQPRVREALDGLSLRLPVFGPLLTKVGVSRFCRMLATLLGAGVPLLQALEIVKGTAGNAVLARVAAAARQAASEGRELAAVLAESPIIPPLVGRMAAVGEETGALDRMLEKAADFYDRETNATVSRLSSLLEPALLVFMGVVVGTVVIAILWPMFRVISGAGLMAGM
ncbi:MAG: type II secretion system F family protein [Thermoanaerobacterales bacterium]|nr:type II secretion system F family protein [Bacillota bacterium]MDI6906740.1 type II secretion system F family protein [Thermoanaerobacterales bacterium]